MTTTQIVLLVCGVVAIAIVGIMLYGFVVMEGREDDVE